MSAASIFGNVVIPAVVAPAVPQMTPRKDWNSVSPSQIVAYRNCPRKWYNASILGDREPQKGNQSKGEGIHKALEVYMTTGEILPVVPMADAQNGGVMVDISTLEYVQIASKFLPPPVVDSEFWAPHQAEGGGIMVEQEGPLPTFEGGPALVQYIDFVEAYSKRAKITDYKTTSDFRYCKTPEELRADTQLNINARWLFAISDYEEIEIGHLYLLTKNVHPKARPVYTTVTRADVEKVWQRDMAIVREMQAWAKLGPSSAEKLPPNTASCDMYGGCYFRGKCGFTSNKTVFQIRSQPKMSDTATPSTAPAKGSFLDRMMQAAQTPAATAAPAPAAAATPPPAELAGLFGAPAANSNAPATATPAPAAAVAPTPPAPETVAAPTPPAAPAAAPVAAPSGLASLFNKAPAAAAPAATAPAAAVAPTPPAPETVAAPTPPAAEIVPVGGMTPADAPPETSTPAEVAAANKPEETAPESEETSTAAPETSTEAASAPAATGEAPGAPKRKRRTKAEMEAARATEGQAPASTSATASAPAPAGAGLASLFGGAAPSAPVTVAAAAPIMETAPPTVTANAPAMEPPVTVAATAPAMEPPVTVAATAPAFGETVNAKAPPTAPKIDGALAALREQLTNPDPAYECPVRVLFIDCAPGKGWAGEAPARLSDYMHAFERAAASSAQALDYRLIRFESKGWLAVGIRVLMKGLPSAIIVDSSTPGADVFESVVTPYASAIFRGTR